MEFKGIDLSPAPFPKDWCSIGGALEALGLHSLGNPGSLTAAAFLAGAGALATAALGAGATFFAAVFFAVAIIFSLIKLQRAFQASWSA